ncbi:hypothetical protein ACHAWF_001832 [Thalassiosira exigua]
MPLPPVGRRLALGVPPPRRRGAIRRTRALPPARSLVRLACLAVVLIWILALVANRWGRAASGGERGRDRARSVRGGKAPRREREDVAAAAPNARSAAQYAQTDAEREREMERLSRDHPGTAFPPFLLYTAARGPSSFDGVERSYRKECRRMNPKYQAYVYDDSTARNFVHRYFPEFAELYDGLERDVMRADVWRYLALYQHGGVYLDLDVECIQPIERWVEGLVDHDSLGGWFPAPKKPDKTPRALLGIEFYDELSPTFQVTQWTMAAEPGFSVFYRTVELIREAARDREAGPGREGPIEDGRVPEVTGPGAVTRAVLEYLVDRGCLSSDQVSRPSLPDHPNARVRDPGYRCIDASKDVVVGELGLLHKNAFGHNWNPPPPGGRGFGGENLFVQHHFAGRWRKEKLGMS